MATAQDISVEQLRINIESDVKGRYEAKFVKDIEDFKERLRIENDQALKVVIDEFKESQKPPSLEEVSKLLSQEYLEFVVEVPWVYESGSPNGSSETTRKFTIRELPQSVEKKFYRKFKGELIPRASDLAALTFEIAGGDAGKKLISLLETLDPGFDLMADAVVMILNPRGAEKEVTREWVQENLSSYRIWNIIYAQTQINRLRDFFSQLSRGSKGMTTTLGARTQS